MHRKKLETDTSLNYLVFDDQEPTDYYRLDEDGFFIKDKVLVNKPKMIELKKSFLKEYRSLIYGAKNIKHLSPKKADGKSIIYYFNSINYLTIWSDDVHGDFVCIEPWMSLPDFEDGNIELDKKESMLKLGNNEDYIFEYKIEF